MFNWLARAWRGDPPGAAPPAVRAPVAPPSPVDDAADGAAPLLAWLAAVAWRDGEARPAECAAIGRLDALLDARKPAVELLPRAPAVIPPLLHMLRHAPASLPAMAERVARDVVLTAEVLRLAKSPYYRTERDVKQLDQAIALIGERGLKAAIARVVLKPLFDAEPGVWSAPAAPRLWQHGEHKAMLCSAFAPDAGVDPLEAYLAGLLHNAGWTVALRELDQAAPPDPPLSSGFCALVVERKDRLFGKVVAGWGLTRAIDALGREVGLRGLERSRSPLAALLRRADRAASRELSAAR